MGVLELPKLNLGYWNTPGGATPDMLHVWDLKL